MAPHVGFDTAYFRDKARREILHLLEGVSKSCQSMLCFRRAFVKQF